MLCPEREPVRTLIFHPMEHGGLDHHLPPCLGSHLSTVIPPLLQTRVSRLDDDEMLHPP